MFDFPESWIFAWDIMKFIDGIVDWVVITFEPFFHAFNIFILRGFLVPFSDFLTWIPWWATILLIGLASWRVVNRRFALLSVGFMLIINLTGLHELSMMTLAITLTSTILCVIMGIPLGIFAARSNWFNTLLKPILDGMQTMPSFVYLIPALMIFGLGKTPAVMATVIYAIPPMIRLTNLGIRQVDPQLMEASLSFGTTPWQTLRKVQIPLAMPTILAGINQTIMMALSMVVLASMIGAKGVGTEVLAGINRLEVGRGFLGGIAIVFLAIILDRISQGIAKKNQ
ncbi:MAG: proline/glycine betaine ABC transporter permease [Dehalococcoidales bacterium]|nr:proline/glycine betaine ABC transporter permease [Dehalococcoidales bacterium]